MSGASRSGRYPPDLLGDERHHGMRNGERALEHVEQVRRGVLVAVVEARLDGLEVPVAELRPEEPVEVEHRVGEVVGVDGAREGADRALQPRQDPPVLERHRPGLQPSAHPRRSLLLRGLCVEEDEPRRVPHLFARSRPCWMRSGE